MDFAPFPCFSNGSSINTIYSNAQITGPTSHPEYMSHLPQATDYRVHAPT